MKQVEVTIMGHGYILGCPEGGEALLALAVAAVDKEMTHIRDSGKVKARERIAVLAALNLAYQLAEGQERGSAATPAATESPQGSGDTGIDLDALIGRVDAALGSDGHLL